MRRAPTRPCSSSVPRIALAAGVAICRRPLLPSPPSALGRCCAAIDAPAALAAGDLGHPHRDPLRRRARDKGVVRVAVDVTATNEKPDATVGRRDHPLLLRRRQPRRPARGPQRARDAGRRRRPRRRRGPHGLPARHGPVPRPDSSSASRRRSASSSTSRRASRARTATSGWGRRSRRSSPGRSGTAGRSGSTCPRRSTSTSRAARSSRSVTTAGHPGVPRRRPSDPLSWFAWVNARNDDGLTREQLDLAGGEVVLVRAWPEDSRWRRRVGGILRRRHPRAHPAGSACRGRSTAR